LVVNLARARVEARAGAPHLLDDVPRVSHENPGVVRRFPGRVEHRCRARHGFREPRRIHLHPMPRAEGMVAFGPEHRPGLDQGEINVEQDCANHEPWYGPAITTAARAGSMTRRAIPFTS